MAQVYGARAASLVVKSSDAALLAAKSLRTASGESTHTSIYEISVQVMMNAILKMMTTIVDDLSLNLL